MGCVTLSFINTHAHTDTEYKLIWKMCWFIRGGNRGKRKSKQPHLVVAISRMPRLVFPLLVDEAVGNFWGRDWDYIMSFFIVWMNWGWYWNFKEGFFLLYGFACWSLTAVASKKKTYFSHYIFDSTRWTEFLWHYFFLRKFRIPGS